MTILKEYAIVGGNGRKTLVDFRWIPNQQPKPVVIFCHGFKGFKDWGAWNLIADQFMKAGFVFGKFNFSHNGGTVEQPIDFPDLEAFGRNTISFELADLKAVLQDVLETPEFFWREEVDFSRIYLIGHSRGGATALIFASENPEIKKLATWASVKDFPSRWPANILTQWKETGVWFQENLRTGQQMPVYYSLVEDYEANIERLDVEAAVKRLNIPQLIVHGEADTVVLPEDARQLLNWNPAAKLVLIPNADHTFNTFHPFSAKELPPTAKLLVDNTISFFKE